MKISRTDTVGCAGCYRKIQVGVVPLGLNFPSGAGVNVWCKVPESTKAVLYTTEVQPGSHSMKEINLCQDCFTGHVTGMKNLSLETLGISVVAAPFVSETKCLKIEGPTKFVSLGEAESVSREMESSSVRSVPAEPASNKISGKRSTANATKDDKGQLNQLLPYYYASPQSQGETNTKDTQVSVQKLTTASPLLNFLAVGSGALGSVEITDDDGTATECVVSLKDEQFNDDEAEYLDLSEYAEPLVQIRTEGESEDEMEQG